MTKYMGKQCTLVNWYCLGHSEDTCKATQNELLDCMFDDCMLLIFNYLLWNHSELLLDYSLSTVLASWLHFVWDCATIYSPPKSMFTSRCGNLAITQLLLLWKWHKLPKHPLQYSKEKCTFIRFISTLVKGIICFNEHWAAISSSLVSTKASIGALANPNCKR